MPNDKLTIGNVEITSLSDGVLEFTSATSSLTSLKIIGKGKNTISARPMASVSTWRAS